MTASDVGEVTRTDVAQAEARLAGAVAERTAAEGTIETSKATYRKHHQSGARLALAAAGAAAETGRRSRSTGSRRRD